MMKLFVFKNMRPNSPPPKLVETFAYGCADRKFNIHRPEWHLKQTSVGTFIDYVVHILDKSIANMHKILICLQRQPSAPIMVGKQHMTKRKFIQEKYYMNWSREYFVIMMRIKTMYISIV